MSIEITGTGTTATSGSELIASRDYSKYIDWIKREFFPITLATPDETIKQCIENAIRYWNTHSGYRTVDMLTINGTTATVPVSFKTVVSVYPSSDNSFFLDGHPLWSLLGISVIENVTSDLIIMQEAFKNYKYYLGSEMRWTFIKSEDPENVGGRLIVSNMPSGIQKIAVVGTKRITAGEDIKQEYILNWLLQYVKALVKQIEGNTLRKAGIINAPNDGQELMNEGKEEQKDMQEQLAKDGRWVTLARRF